MIIYNEFKDLINVVLHFDKIIFEIMVNAFKLIKNANNNIVDLNISHIYLHLDFELNILKIQFQLIN